MDLDRQSIERRDFPIGRRGYEPAAVDAHLRTLAADVEELEQSLLSARGHETLGSAAASQVQSILEAAEATAADIERQAAEEAAETRRHADEDAQRTRSDAIARAQQHVAAVSHATAELLEKVESMDQEVSALVQSLRAGAGRLASDLRAVETNMGELYDAASGSSSAVTGDIPALEGAGESAVPSVPVEPQSAAPAGPAAPAVSPMPVARPASQPPPAYVAPSTPPAVQAAPASNGSSEQPLRTPAASGSVGAPSVSGGAPGKSSGGEADLDGARLIALNMALNGEPRAQADRYLAENFDLPDREKLLDEVYAAIEG